MDAGTLTFYVNGAVQPHLIRNLQGKMLFPAVQFHADSWQAVELTSIVTVVESRELQVGGTHMLALRLISEMVKGGAKFELSREVSSAFLRAFVSGGMLGSVLEIFGSAGKEYRAVAAECALSFVQPAVARAVLSASHTSIGTAEASAASGAATGAGGGGGHGDSGGGGASVFGAADSVHDSDALEMGSVHELVVAKCHVLQAISLALELAKVAGKNLDALKTALMREGDLLSIVVSRVQRIEDFWSVSLVKREGKLGLPAEAESKSAQSATLLQLSRSLMKAVCTLVSLMDDAALMRVSFADIGIAVTSVTVRNLVWICSNDVLRAAVDLNVMEPERRFDRLSPTMVDRSRYFAVRMLQSATAPPVEPLPSARAEGVVENASPAYICAQLCIATMPEGLQRLVWSEALDLTCKHVKACMPRENRTAPRRGHRTFGRRFDLSDYDVDGFDVHERPGHGTDGGCGGGGGVSSGGVAGVSMRTLKRPTSRGDVMVAMTTGVSLVTLSQLVASLLLQVFSPAALLQALRSFVSSTSGSVVSSRRHEAGFGLNDIGSGIGSGADTSRAGGDTSQVCASTQCGSRASVVLHHNAQELSTSVACASYIIDDSAEPDSLAIALPGLLSVAAAIDDLMIRATTPGLTAASMVALSESQSDPVVGPWCRQLVENDALALCLQLFTAIDEEQSRLVAALKDKESDTGAVMGRGKDGGGGECNVGDCASDVALTEACG
jgi:uncharacterized membrane protein YgcG